MTKVMTKSSKINRRTTQVNQRSIKNNSRVQDKNQEEFKTQEESLESRIKRRLNQDKYEKVFLKNWIAHGFSQNMFTKEFLLSGNRLPDCCNRLPVAKLIWKSFQMNLQCSNSFQKVVIDYNVLVIDYQCLWTLKFKFKCEESHPFT